MQREEFHEERNHKALCFRKKKLLSKRNYTRSNLKMESLNTYHNFFCGIFLSRLKLCNPIFSKLTFTCSKLAIETLRKGVKYVQN